MIGKTKIGRGFKGTIGYCLDESKKPEILHQNGAVHNNPQGLTREFVVISSENQNISKPVWHSSLSFAKEDEMTNKRMVEIANRLLEKAGFSKDNNQFLIIKHNNTKHTHCHIVANRVGFDGKAVSDYYSKSRTVQYAKELEKEFHLVKTNDVAKKRRLINQQNKAIDPVKDHLKTVLKKALGKPHVNSFDKFANALQKQGIQVNLAKHRKTGKVFGVSYTYKGNTYKGSDLGKKFAFKGLTDQLGDVGLSAAANLAPAIKIVRRAANIISKSIDF